jgi:aldose 1-epimerase
MAYRVSTLDSNGRTVYLLHDDESGARAAVLPSYGFNLFDLRLPAAGAVRRVVVAREGWEHDPDKPGRNGFPVLFPFPNRIRAGRYAWRGEDYALPLNKPPHAIHGFAIDAPWDVVAHAADAAGASIAGRFQISRQAPEQAANWPADAILELRYTLAGRRLTLEATVINPSAADLPFGLGFHPYFRLPLEPGGDPAQTRVILPASRYWVLDGSLPTGERREVDGPLDFRRGRPMAGLEADDVLTGLDFEGGWCTCRLVDLALGAEFRLACDRSFRELVVFTPPGPGGVLAVEPYTQTTDAIHLQAEGIDGGLRVLGPGARACMRLVMETRG